MKKLAIVKFYGEYFVSAIIDGYKEVHDKEDFLKMQREGQIEAVFTELD